MPVPCPLCLSVNPAVFLVRQNVPVYQNVLFPDAQSAIGVLRGDLEMALCQDCGFVFNRAFDESKLIYAEDYDNNQIYSPLFHAYVDALADYLVDDRSLRNKKIVEIGCGKGYFLKKLIERDDRNYGIGFDPTYLGDLDSFDGRLRFERQFYDESCRDVVPDAVVCRHVIEHVADPLRMLLSVRRALTDAPHAQIFFETPCAEWILRNHVVWDFFYEHCSLFTADSLAALFNRAGFEVTSVRHTFEGQYLWLEARPAAASATVMDTAPIMQLARLYGQSEHQLIAKLVERVKTFGTEGGVAIWGAGAKGVTLAHLIDPERQLIDCVVDLNPRKQGRFVPGTGHPIVDYRDLSTRNVRSAIVMNPNYAEENRQLLKDSAMNIVLYVEGE
jgi:SAM-dependent methyltransferase